MPRATRKLSYSGIYHVMMRGINRQQIFYDDEDYICMTERLKYYKGISNYQIYAYCLMGNHLHLLLKVNADPLEIITRRLGASFVLWYNQKYQRTGQLFQDRFKSEAVENDRYFLVALRYILQNPVKAGKCNTPLSYKYSSMKEYAGEIIGITDTDFALGMAGRENLIDFINTENDDKCIDMDENVRYGISDTTAIKHILTEFGTLHNIGNTKAKHEQIKSIKKLYKTGMSIRQMCRLTGISKYRIESALKK